MPSQSAKTFGPYSPVRRVGDLYFVAGQVGVDAVSKTAAKDVQSQTAQAIENMLKILSVEGLTLKNVVKTTLFLTDIGDYAAVNEVYLQYFSEPRPVRSAVAVKELPRVANVPLKIEIEAIAARKPE